MTLCEKCTKAITKNSPGLQCFGFCGGSYHANSTCSDVSKGQFGLIKSLPGGSWICAECRTRTRTSTSTRTRSADGEGTQMNRARAACSRSPQTLTNANADASINVNPAGVTPDSNISGFVKALKSQMQLLRESVEVCSERISDFERKLSKLGDYFKVTDALKAENTKLKRDVTMLNKRLNNVEQYGRSSNVEIHDIPEKPGENLVDVVKAVGRAVKFDVNTDKIDTVFRVPTKSDTKAKNIVVRFISKLHRDDFLEAARVARRTQVGQNGFRLDGISDRFFINEHLPPQTKMLLKEVRDEARKLGHKFVWVQGGNILVRKSENSKIVQVTEIGDMKQL